MARRMTKFVELNTIGVSKDSQLRAAKVLRAVSDGYDNDEHSSSSAPAQRHRLFDFGRRKMVERWSMLRAAAAASGVFSLPEETTGHCNFANETAANNPGTHADLARTSARGRMLAACSDRLIGSHRERAIVFVSCLQRSHGCGATGRTWRTARGSSAGTRS